MYFLFLFFPTFSALGAEIGSLREDVNRFITDAQKGMLLYCSPGVGGTLY